MVASYKERLPPSIKHFLIFVFVWNALGALGGLASDNPECLVVVVIWSALVYPLYLQLVKKKAWARTCLMVLTFPVGTAMLMMREVKLYMLQKD